MGMISEFKEFASKGNVVDLAVGVVIGAAFGKIVTSFVEDVILPPIGLLMGRVDFGNLYLPLDAKVPGSLSLLEAKKLGPVLAYGSFLNSILQFLIVAIAIFMVVKAINRFRKPTEVEVVGPSEDVLLLTEIRDLLKR